MKAKQEGKEEGEGDTGRELPAPDPTYSQTGCLRAILDCFSEANNSFLESPASRCMYCKAFPHENGIAMYNVLSGWHQQVRGVPAEPHSRMAPRRRSQCLPSLCPQGLCSGHPGVHPRQEQIFHHCPGASSIAIFPSCSDCYKHYIEPQS